MVELQRLRQAIEFVTVLVEVFRILEQEPTGALEDAAVVVATGQVIQLTAEGAELVVEQLDDMEAIENMHSVGNVLTHGPDVGFGHVGGHGLDASPAATQLSPEDFQGFGAFAVADDGAAEEMARPIRLFGNTLGCSASSQFFSAANTVKDFS